MDGKSQRSRSGPMMFSEPNSKTPFSKLRFVVDSLAAPLGGGGGVARSDGEGRRFGLPADPLLEGVLRDAPMPHGILHRLHALVDELPEESAT